VRGAALAAALALAGAVASAQAAPYVYVGDRAGNVFQYGVGSGGLLSPLSPPSIDAGGELASQVAVTPDGKSVFVTTETGIAQYDILAGGLLTPKNPPVLPLSPQPGGIAISPDGRSAYVTQLFNTVAQFDIVAGGGTLAPKPTPSVLLVGELGGLTVSPDGRSVYVGVTQATPDSPAAVAQYDVGAGGALVPKTPPAVPAGIGPTGGVAVSPDAKSLYLVNGGSETISQYDIGAGGRATPKSVNAAGAGDSPSWIALTPDGKTAYGANVGEGEGGSGGSISEYNVLDNGELIGKRPATLPADNAATVAVSADGQSVYVSGREVVYQFDVSSNNDQLRPKSPATVPGGQGIGLAISPVLATPGADVLFGTAGPNTICGLGGKDEINGLGGDDVLYGDRCGQKNGKGSHDVLRGGGGRDKLFGGAGRDRLNGGRGHDRIHGGPGRDRIVAGAGRDVLDVRDGGRDRVDCGDGRDKIKVDANDRVRNCERVR
jgi:DNA-binding beta-propeller fold protein YncE